MAKKSSDVISTSNSADAEEVFESQFVAESDFVEELPEVEVAQEVEVEAFVTPPRKVTLIRLLQDYRHRELNRGEVIPSGTYPRRESPFVGRVGQFALNRLIENGTAFIEEIEV